MSVAKGWTSLNSNKINMHTQRNRILFEQSYWSIWSIQNWWMKEEKKRRVVDERTTNVPSLQYFDMWTVSSDVSIQRRHWQPLSVHLWAYCTHPPHDVNDMTCENIGKQNPCSGPLPVYQGLSMHYDWLVKKAIVDLLIRMKGNLKPVSVKRRLQTRGKMQTQYKMQTAEWE